MEEQNHNTAAPDMFVPDTKVAAEFGVSLMALWRWDRSHEMADLGWPPKIAFNKRNFRSRPALEDFKRAMIRKAVAARARLREPEAA